MSYGTKSSTRPHALELHLVSSSGELYEDNLQGQCSDKVEKRGGRQFLAPMPGPDRLTVPSDFPELRFVEREATPEPAMKFGIHLHLAGLSLADTVSVLENLDVKRCRSTMHNWVQKAELQPTDGRNPNYVAIDETVIQVNDQRYWLYAALCRRP